MTTFLPDTSCMVALLSSAHTYHAVAATELNRRLDRGERMVVAAHALIETYAVLTRLPEPHRLPAAQVRLALEAGFIQGRQVVALDGEEYASLLGEWAANRVLGGRVYDALIAACARKADVDALITFNERHFRGLIKGPMALTVPGGSADSAV